MGIFPIIFPIIFLAFPKNAVIPRVSRPIRCGYLYTRQIEFIGKVCDQLIHSVLILDQSRINVSAIPLMRSSEIFSNSNLIIYEIK